MDELSLPSALALGSSAYEPASEEAHKRDEDAHARAAEDELGAKPSGAD
jgi:hypothetical protein